MRRWRLWFLALMTATPFVLVENLILGICHKRQKPQASTPQARIRNHQTIKVANAKVRNRYTDQTLSNLTYIIIGIPIIRQLRTLAFARWRMRFLALSNASRYFHLCAQNLALDFCIRRNFYVLRHETKAFS